MELGILFFCRSGTMGNSRVGRNRNVPKTMTNKLRPNKVNKTAVDRPKGKSERRKQILMSCTFSMWTSTREHKLLFQKKSFCEWWVHFFDMYRFLSFHIFHVFVIVCIFATYDTVYSHIFALPTCFADNLTPFSQRGQSLRVQSTMIWRQANTDPTPSNKRKLETINQAFTYATLMIKAKELHWPSFPPAF